MMSTFEDRLATNLKGDEGFASPLCIGDEAIAFYNMGVCWIIQKQYNFEASNGKIFGESEQHNYLGSRQV